MCQALFLRSLSLHELEMICSELVHSLILTPCNHIRELTVNRIQFTLNPNHLHATRLHSVASDGMPIYLTSLTARQ